MDNGVRGGYAPSVVQPMTGPQFRFFLLLLVVLTMGIGGLLFWLMADEAHLAQVRALLKPEREEDGRRGMDSGLSVPEMPTPQMGVELIRLEQENALLQAELERTKAELERAEAELAALKRPMEEDVVSSKVQATLEEGEVLVTGGFQTADGLVQFTFVEQSVKRGANGSEAVEFSGRQVALSPELAAQFGLDSMQTTAGNVLQHGEAWTREEFEGLMRALSETSGAEIVTSPRVTTPMDGNALIQIGGYQMTLSGQRPAGGTGLNVEVRVEMPRQFDAATGRETIRFLEGLDSASGSILNNAP